MNEKVLGGLGELSCQTRADRDGSGENKLGGGRLSLKCNAQTKGEKYMKADVQGTWPSLLKAMELV